MYINQVLRNYTHGSDIVLVLCNHGGNIFYKKSSSSQAGIDSLRKEYEGYLWYEKKQNLKNIISVSCDVSGYYEIAIPKKNGCRLGANILSEHNIDYFYLAMSHYYDVWGSVDNTTGIVPLHGDFSLDGNILINGKDIHIIDWEHFTLNGAPLGYDILYMIFEALKITSKSQLPSDNSLRLVKDLLNYAIDMRIIDECFLDNILINFLVEQNKIKSIWGAQFYKLPTNHFTPQQIDSIVRYTSNNSAGVVSQENN